jgi:hypothetical protein
MLDRRELDRVWFSVDDEAPRATEWRVAVELYLASSAQTNVRDACTMFR